MTPSGPRCPRCGKPLPFFENQPAVAGELCSWCATGHDPEWRGDAYPNDWWLTRAVRRVARRLHLEHRLFRSN